MFSCCKFVWSSAQDNITPDKLDMGLTHQALSMQVSYPVCFIEGVGSFSWIQLLVFASASDIFHSIPMKPLSFS